MEEIAMIDQKEFYNCLQKAGVEFITGVPDSLLNDFCKHVETELPLDRHVIAANEGNAIALAAGYHLATGTVPLVYMQNSGLGNAMNPLLSLTNKEVYSIPMVLLVGWRGCPGVKDHAQHKKQGELTPSLLELMDIPFRVMEDNLEVSLINAEWAVRTAKELSAPTALVVKKGVFAKAEKTNASEDDNRYSMSRENAIECIFKYLPEDTIYVATTGRATRELYELSKSHEAGSNLVFLNVGAMGHASQIAAGMALANKKRLVVCLDGDGAAIMHLGGLTTLGKLNQPNLLHVVLNNGAHESVGGQPTAGYQVNFTAVAAGCCYKTIDAAVDTEHTLQEALDSFISVGGPFFGDVHVRKGIRSDLKPLEVSLTKLKKILMKAVID
jgi:phosphonopyruvate decarboxylase